MKKPSITLAKLKKIKREAAAIMKQTDELRQRAKHASDKALRDYCPWEHGDVIEINHRKRTFRPDRATVHRVEHAFSDDQKEPWMLVVNFHSKVGKPLKARSYVWPKDYEIKLAPKPPAYPVQFRPLPWFNIRTQKEMFGIQASVQKGKWQHAHEAGKPLVYATAKERDAKLKELRSKA